MSCRGDHVVVKNIHNTQLYCSDLLVLVGGVEQKIGLRQTYLVGIGRLSLTGNNYTFFLAKPGNDVCF